MEIEDQMETQEEHLELVEVGMTTLSFEVKANFIKELEGMEQSIKEIIKQG